MSKTNVKAKVSTSNTETLCELQKVLDFHNHKIAQITFRGRKCWLLQEIEAGMEYAEGALAGLIRDEWIKEFIRGTHLDVLTGQDFKVFATLYNLPAKTRSITIVYTEGVDLICIKTDKPIGVELRAFLVEKVMPRIREEASDEITTKELLHRLALLESKVANDNHLHVVVVKELQGENSALKNRIVMLEQKQATDVGWVSQEWANINIYSKFAQIARLSVICQKHKSISSARRHYENKARNAVCFNGRDTGWGKYPRDPRSIQLLQQALDGYMSNLLEQVSEADAAQAKREAEHSMKNRLNQQELFDDKRKAN